MSAFGSGVPLPPLAGAQGAAPPSLPPMPPASTGDPVVDGLGGLPSEAGMPPMPPMFRSTDPAAIADFIASMFRQMADEDHAMLEQEQQAALAQAEPMIQAMLGQSAPPVGAPPVDPSMAFGEGAAAPVDPMVGY